MKKLILLLILTLSIIIASCGPQNEVTVDEDLVKTTDNPSLVNEIEVESVKEPIEETANEEDNNKEIKTEEVIEEEEIVETSNNEIPSWQNFELKDVSSGQTYKISDFQGKPVLIESFAVWCSICTRQQGEVKKLHEEVGDDIISIAINADPNENENKILEHIESYGFDWKYSVSPIDLTKELIEEFGTSVVSAPSAPMILVCGDSSYHFLERGIKTASTLKNTVSEKCSA